MNQKSRPHRSWYQIFFLLGVCSLCATSYASDPTMKVEDKTLKLIGAGLREFLFIDIYRMSAYSETGSCKPSDIVYKNENKALRLKMLRDIPAERMRSTLRDTLEANLPEGKPNTKLKKKIEEFLARYKTDLKKGSYIELIYIKDKGTIVKRDGVRLGITTGKGFADLLWKSYFGGNTCCSSLKSDILKECKGK